MPAGRVSLDATGPDAAALSAERARASALQAFVAVTDTVPAPRPGPLAGLPYAVKDMFDTPGRAPTLGLATAPRPAPAGQAAVLTALDAAGAVRIGFTTMTPLAYEPSGANPDQGRPRNPWDADAICGGSSSGSAVAVAAGIVPIAIGSDTAGSLRIPAQACGVTAWKPGTAVVPAAGATGLAPSLDCIGFLASSASLMARVAALFAPASGAITHVRLAEDVLEGCTASSAAGARGIAAALQAAGVRVSGAPGTLATIEACDPIALLLLQAEPADVFADLMAAGTLDAALAARLAKGHTVSPAALADARATLTRLRATALPGLFGDADAVLLPVMRIDTPSVAECEPGSPDFSARTLYALSALTRFVNVLGLPAVALPAGLDGKGRPRAAQLVGRPGSDRALLALASDLQATAPPIMAGDPTTSEAS